MVNRYDVFSSAFFRLYTLAWRMARPFLHLQGRIREGWSERLAPEGWAEPVDVWLQAASGGEARLAATLLEAWPEPSDSQRPQPVRILVATWTRQGKDVLEARLPALRLAKPWLHVQTRYAPLDDPTTARRAVRQAAPRILALLETELWPGLMGACTEAGVPICLINARMTKSSYEWYGMLRSTLRRMAPQRVLAISGEDAARFAGIFSREARCEDPDGREPCVIDIMPNMKFDNAMATLTCAPSRELAPLFRRVGPVYLLASVRKKEETRIAPHLIRLMRRDPTAVLVVAPRHMERVGAWMAMLADLGLKPLRASALADNQPLAPGGVLVWDRFGDLPSLYAVANAAFVGGSLDLGGQNFLEALAAGLVPCVGPSLTNFRWALGEGTETRGLSLPASGLLDICASFREAADVMYQRAHEPLSREETRMRFLTWIGPRTGGSAHAARFVAEWIATRECARQE